VDLTASPTGPGSGAACRPTPSVTQALHSPIAECGPSESPPAWAFIAAMSLLGQDGACRTHLSPFASLARAASSGRCWTRSLQSSGLRQGTLHRDWRAGTRATSQRDANAIAQSAAPPQDSSRRSMG
jgi:hypothetical protein